MRARLRVPMWARRSPFDRRGFASLLGLGFNGRAPAYLRALQGAGVEGLLMADDFIEAPTTFYLQARMSNGKWETIGSGDTEREAGDKRGEFLGQWRVVRVVVTASVQTVVMNGGPRFARAGTFDSWAARAYVGAPQSVR